MSYSTIVATIDTDTDPAVVEAAVRDALASVGATVVPCWWAPDLDTVADGIMHSNEGVEVEYGANGLIDLS